MRRALTAASHTVLEAAGAAQALALCRRHAPDVLVADAALSARDGLDLLAAVKGDTEVFRTAVVCVLPEDVAPERVRDEMARGAQDVIVAPVGDGELFARVQAAGRTKILQEELVEQTRRIERHLYEDPLTRVHNRRFLFTHLGALVSGARRHERPLSVAVIDIDDFKGVNDRHGHQAGDEVLVAVAGSLRACVRAEDAVGRLGGEEFLVVLPDTGPFAAARTAERLRLAVAAAGGPVPVTASVGWATLAPGEDPDGLVRRADDALYEAKAAGRDRVRGAVEGPATLPRRR